MSEPKVVPIGVAFINRDKERTNVVDFASKQRRPQASFFWWRMSHYQLEDMVQIDEYLPTLERLGCSIEFYSRSLSALQPMMKQFERICPEPPEEYRGDFVKRRFADTRDVDLLEQLRTATRNLRSSLYLACSRANNINEVEAKLAGQTAVPVAPRMLVARPKSAQDDEIRELIALAANPEIVCQRVQNLIVRARADIAQGDTLAASKAMQAAEKLFKIGDDIDYQLSRRTLIELLTAGQ